eukprot:25877_1
MLDIGLMQLGTRYTLSLLLFIGFPTLIIAHPCTPAIQINYNDIGRRNVVSKSKQMTNALFKLEKKVLLHMFIIRNQAKSWRNLYFCGVERHKAKILLLVLIFKGFDSLRKCETINISAQRSIL